MVGSGRTGPGRMGEVRHLPSPGGARWVGGLAVHGGQIRYLPPTYLHGRGCHDGFWPPSRQSQDDSAGSCCPVRHLCHPAGRPRPGVQSPGSERDRDHRWGGRAHGDLLDLQTGRPPDGAHCGFGILLHGSGPYNPAAYHASGRARGPEADTDGTAQRGEKRVKIIFPIAVTVFVGFLLPTATPLIGALMLGNLFRESGVVDRLLGAAQNELLNIVTIFLGVGVGATMTAQNFLNWQTISILLLGLVAFMVGTTAGLLLARLMNLIAREPVNPLIGSAGVSAVPMAARVSQVVGQEADPDNYLLMHAMGPNVAGVIGSAVAAGILLAIVG